MVSEGFLQSRFTNRNFWGGPQYSECMDTPNQTKRGQDLGRWNTREVTEQRLCLLAGSPKDQLCSRDKGNGGGQAMENGPTNHPVPGGHR